MSCLYPIYIVWVAFSSQLSSFEWKERLHQAMNSLSQIAWSKFKKDFLGVIALCAIVLAVVVSIFGLSYFS